MKSEDRIVGLLAGYLQKVDQLLDRMSRTDRSVDIMSRALAENSIKFNDHNAKFIEHSAKFNEQNAKFNDHSVKFNEQNAKFNEHNVKFNEHSVRFNQLQEEIKSSQASHQGEMKILNGRIYGLQSEQNIMLKELLSLSKRVSVVESKV